MSGFVLSPAARADLDEIWEYTAERWSIEQAERYIRVIVDTCQALADGRRAGAAVDHIRKGYFKLAVGSHVVFYRRPGPTETIVVRVLSAWMWRATAVGERPRAHLFSEPRWQPPERIWRLSALNRLEEKRVANAARSRGVCKPTYSVEPRSDVCPRWGQMFEIRIERDPTTHRGRTPSSS